MLTDTLGIRLKTEHKLFQESVPDYIRSCFRPEHVHKTDYVIKQM